MTDADRAREMLAAHLYLDFLTSAQRSNAIAAMLAYAAEREAQAHAAGLEEAAKVADRIAWDEEAEDADREWATAKRIANAIRARITTTGGGENG